MTDLVVACYFAMVIYAFSFVFLVEKLGWGKTIVIGLFVFLLFWGIK